MNTFIRFAYNAQLLSTQLRYGRVYYLFDTINHMRDVPRQEVCMQAKKRILIVDDDPSVHIAIKYTLREKYECLSSYHSDEALVILQKNVIDLVLLDLHLRTQHEGLDTISRIKELEPDLDIIVISGQTQTNVVTQAIQRGASHYLVKDFSSEQLLITVETVLGQRALLNKNDHFLKNRRRFLEKFQIIGQSQIIKKLIEDIQKIQKSNANVILTGETGCGKELVAQHIAAANGRPFIALDSATITSSMAEGILFGHEKGAFTGAHQQNKGFFEEANGGTVYFDEISNMPLEIQSKLLRVIQEKEIKRVGSTKSIPLEFRVICATNKDLEDLCRQGLFQYDLYQRLNVINLRVPALRERPEDIPLLVEYFFKTHRCENSPIGLNPAAMEFLCQYDWPGNVRELSNLIANLCTMCIGKEIIEIDDLPLKVRENKKVLKNEFPNLFHPDLKIDFYKNMHTLEGQVLSEYYKHFDGNISQMSKELKMSRSHLYSKLQSHGIH